MLTRKDAVLKEVRDCILQNDAQRRKEVNPYIFSYWRDLHVRTVKLRLCGRTCSNTTLNPGRRVRKPTSHSTRQLWNDNLGQYAFWPYMHREILNKAATCSPCTDFGKNLKPVVPASKWKPLLNCSEPNEEIQIDFGGPITNEKIKMYIFSHVLTIFPYILLLKSLIKLMDLMYLNFQMNIFEYTVFPETLG